ncbi:hypothetical protein [Salinibaculum rarum]|uniref:hypothetical protein n=1 Tax=Salinibaculum rarum TaxID=3058903 RepID=UPI002660450F|nr:hypothetical protein [Salinibaculum sp. KK48]
MVYPAVAAVAGALVAIIYAIRRKLSSQQSSGGEDDSSSDESDTRTKQHMKQSPGEQSGDPQGTESVGGSASNPSMDRRKVDSGAIPTDVTSQGRVHSLILSDVKNDGTGIGRFHG